jgi:predicted  nucleic acid-binding Zn-ribbon protein
MTCPKCGYNGSSYKFRRPKPGEETKKPAASEPKTEPSEKDSKKLDESKFERP